MKRSEIYPLPQYFDSYINQCDDVELTEAIQTSIIELQNAPIDTWRALGDLTYAPNKWTVKEMLQHLVGFILAGHQRWHFRILEERYYPLL